MIRLEPGDKMIAISRFHAPKPDKGVHLVQIAPDGFFHSMQTVDERVAGDIRQRRFPMQDTPDELID